MHPTQQTAITLVVVNSDRLEGRSTSSHVFFDEGGTLGSSPYDDWLLQDHAGRIRPSHAELIRIDGRFCLIDRSGHTFINHATLPLGRDRKVALRDSDELLIGEYRLRVHLGDRQAQTPGIHPLGTLMGEENDVVVDNMRPRVGEHEIELNPAPVQDDPMDALGGVTPGAAQHDPMTALNRGDAAHSSIETLDEMPYARSNLGAQWHQQARRDTAVELPDIQGERVEHASFTPDDSPRPPSYARARPQASAAAAPSPSPSSSYLSIETHTRVGTTPASKRSSGMDEQQLNDLERSVGEQLEDRWQKPAGRSLGHVGADPLLRGLGLDLPFRDSEEQQAFLEEAGLTLRAALEGLITLHHAQSDSRYPLRDRRLQPIEDNPLRLGQDVEATAETLFSAQRSPVHLSAPEAVAECLRHQGQHQVAVEEAIDQALETILDAFSPEALSKRFHAYRGASSRIDNESGWAWEMYHHYYRELSSGRQQGFKKLFWEVFEQSYDHSVRRQQREGL